MLGLFSNVTSTLKVATNLKKITIDNAALKLQYRVTTTALIIATTIVTAQQFIGKPIDCLQSSGSIDTNVLNTYCFFIGTYSVINNDTGYPMHGIGPDQGSETTRHLYYQWVPFYLFFLSITFYSPHFFWKAYEKGKLKKILVGMEYLHYSVSDQHVGDIPSRKEREEQLNILAKYMWCRIKNSVNANWAKGLFITEVYALLHAIFALCLTDVFLGGTGAFYGLTLKTSPEVFPTMSKCLFHKYGPSGGLQKHDALCVLALNIVNEKIFYMLHFWFPFVVAVAIAAIVWRLIAFCFYRNISFNRLIIRKNNSMVLDNDDKKVVLDTISYWDWIFLCYLGGNSDGFVFQELYAELAQCIRNDGMDSDDDSESTGLMDGEKKKH